MYNCSEYFHSLSISSILFFFFVNVTATTEIYTLSLHAALPISGEDQRQHRQLGRGLVDRGRSREDDVGDERSEEHTTELQSPDHLVCRLLLEKKKKKKKKIKIKTYNTIKNTNE